jgi:methionine-rich copper-binding protein CopC
MVQRGGRTSIREGVDRAWAWTADGDSSDPRLLIVTLPDDLAAGPVAMGYHILSVDGHVVDAQLTFTIKKPG